MDEVDRNNDINHKVIKMQKFKFIFKLLVVSSILFSDNNKRYMERFEANVMVKVELDYLLYLPSDYRDSNKTYPLVLFLHGAGERGENIDLVEIHGIPKLIKKGRKFPFITIAPQCPSDQWWSDSAIVKSLISLIEKFKSEYNVDQRSIYATGLSMGGYGTIAIAIERPDLFAGIIPICGGGDLKMIDRLIDIPILLFHGVSDTVVPVKNSSNIYDILKPVNNKAKITIYNDVGHDSWTQTYSNDNIYEWLLKQKK